MCVGTRVRACVMKFISPSVSLVGTKRKCLLPVVTSFGH